MSADAQQVFEQYVVAGAMLRDADAVAALFADDGVLEWPLQRVTFTGPGEIRHGLREFYAGQAEPTADADPVRSRYALHTTADPDTFVVEIDTAYDGIDDETPMVQIFRVRDGLIVRLRDYFDGGAPA
ncbi:nuclear transport factor 2 family protein [Catenuloplanes japonicus]|uniref:nuclear transport factor 2 family protein n=1 Tax=Catenuloplanes japonicus TaxID=33876 RepID=UPI0005265572|nr:nuclear transport factor 2 family protein [Catenuloplanes japonicus]